MKTIRGVKALINAGLVEEESMQQIEQVIQKFSVALPSQIVELLNNDTQTSAIARQFLPSAEELHISKNDLPDPIGDKRHEAVKGVIHRHSDRCLLLPITACPVYCRFCFRRENIGKKEKALSKDELETAYRYIAEHPEIWEVILSGGDPLILKPKSIKEIICALDKISHVEVIRIHTRVPVVDPIRVNEALIEALKMTKKAVYVLLHSNHPAEFTENAKNACARFIDAGIPMLSQTVLIKGVNDTPEIMGELMRTFVKNRIKPHYLHHADLALGTSHFRTSIQEGQAIMKQLRKKCSGLCQPMYVLDIPGGFGKVPVGYSYLQKDQSDIESYIIEDYQGNPHLYEA